MIDRELMDAISQLLDVKLTNELGPIKYEIKSIKEEVRGIRDEVREIKAEVKAGREDIKNLSQTVDSLEKRLKKVENVQDHHMHSEFYIVEESEAKKVNDTKDAGGRVICVGTTSCRTVESAADENGRLKSGSGWTDIFIYPGYQFKILDALITNFHLPESTLVMLVSALAGREHVLAAYEEAIKERYRFFSFGDAMLIL